MLLVSEEELCSWRSHKARESPDVIALSNLFTPYTLEILGGELPRPRPSLTERDLICSPISQGGRISHADDFKHFVSAGPTPFPSRTRKLSLLGPMVLRVKLRGRVGSRRDILKGPLESFSWAGFLVFVDLENSFPGNPDLSREVAGINLTNSIRRHWKIDQNRLLKSCHAVIAILSSCRYDLEAFPIEPDSTVKLAKND